MIWNKHLYWVMLWLPIVLQSCGIYSFSGISLSPDVKSFSLQIQSNVALGPPDLVEKFTEKLGKELLQRTQMRQVDSQGDMQLEGTITKFEYAAAAPSAQKDGSQASRTRLTITMQLNYINPNNEEFQFSKRQFSQYADMSADKSTDAEEPRLVEEIFTKLVKDIFNASVASF